MKAAIIAALAFQLLLFGLPRAEAGSTKAAPCSESVQQRYILSGKPLGDCHLSADDLDGLEMARRDYLKELAAVRERQRAAKLRRQSEHRQAAACSEAAVELYVFHSEPLAGCYLPQERRDQIEALHLRYLDVEDQYRRRMAELDRLQLMLGALPATPPADPYVDNYIAPFAAQPFRTCRVYPGAGVDCTGF
jgi:hypothetical protein